MLVGVNLTAVLEQECIEEFEEAHLGVGSSSCAGSSTVLLSRSPALEGVGLKQESSRRWVGYTLSGGQEVTQGSVLAISDSIYPDQQGDTFVWRLTTNGWELKPNYLSLSMWERRLRVFRSGLASI